MNYKRISNKIIYHFDNSQFAMTEDGKGYILEGNRWLDENTYKFHRLINTTDRILMQELEKEVRIW